MGYYACLGVHIRCGDGLEARIGHLLADVEVELGDFEVGWRVAESRFKERTHLWSFGSGLLGLRGQFQALEFGFGLLGGPFGGGDAALEAHEDGTVLKEG